VARARASGGERETRGRIPMVLLSLPGIDKILVESYYIGSLKWAREGRGDPLIESPACIYEVNFRKMHGE